MGYYILAGLVMIVGLAASAALLYLPFWLIGLLTGAKATRRKRTTQEQVVSAQWEYDRTLRRRD